MKQHNEHIKAFIAYRDRDAILIAYPDRSGYWLYYPDAAAPEGFSEYFDIIETALA